MLRFVRLIQTWLGDPRIILPLILLFILFNTAPGVFRNELWNDEFRTWRDGIEKPLSAVLSWQHNPDHAPLGHLLARSGAALFGVENPWSLRLGNYLCGLLCVPALWWMGRTLASGAVGLVMAAFFAVDPNCMDQIILARMYGVLLLAGIIGVTLAGSLLIDAHRPWRRVALCGVALGVGIWAHSQIYAVLIAILLLALGLLAKERRAALPLFASLLISGLIGLQGIAKMVARRDAEKIEDVKPLPAGEQLFEAFKGLGGEEWIAYVLLATAVAGAGAFFLHGRRTLALLVTLVMLVAIVNLAVAAMYRPVAHARYLTILQPAMWLAMAYLLVELCRSKARWTLGVAGVGLTIGLSVYEYTRMLELITPSTRSFEFAQACRQVRREMGPGDRVVFVPRVPYTMFSRYYGLGADWAIDSALGERDSVRKQRAMLREARLDQGTIWLIGFVTPPRKQDPSKDVMRGVHPLDDAVKVAERILGARGIDPSGTSRTPGVKETKRMLFLHIGQASVEEIKVPMQLQRRIESENGEEKGASETSGRTDQ
jgi:hypothetical protein